jgi:hypothetical protein
MQVFTLPEGKDFEKHATVVWGDGKHALIQLLRETKLYIAKINFGMQFSQRIFGHSDWLNNSCIHSFISFIALHS